MSDILFSFIFCLRRKPTNGLSIRQHPLFRPGDNRKKRKRRTGRRSALCSYFPIKFRNQVMSAPCAPMPNTIAAPIPKRIKDTSNQQKKLRA